MEEKDIIKKLEKARLSMHGFKAHGARVKAVLFSRKIKEERKYIPEYFKILTAMAGMFVLAIASYYVVDNMDKGNKFNKNGGIWSTYSDVQEGGDSKVWPPPASATGNDFVMSKPGYGGEGYAVRITGMTGSKLGLNYNYFGVVNRFSSDSSCPKCKGANIKKYSGIMFRIKGKILSGNLFFILPYEGNECVAERLTCKSLTGYADYEKDITNEVKQNWNFIVIDFRRDLRQPYWTPNNAVVPIEKVLENVHLFKWQFKNGDGNLVDIWIDNVRLF